MIYFSTAQTDKNLRKQLVKQIGETHDKYVICYFSHPLFVLKENSCHGPKSSK